MYGLWYVAGDDHLAWMTTPSWPHAAATAATHAAMLLQYPVPMHSTESFVHATTFLGAWGGVPIVHAAWPRATRATDAAAGAVAALLPPPVMQAWRQGSPVLQVSPQVPCAFACVRPCPKFYLVQDTDVQSACRSMVCHPVASCCLNALLILESIACIRRTPPLASTLPLPCCTQGARLFLGVALVLVTRVVAKALLTPLVKGALELLPIRYVHLPRQACFGSVS